MNRKINLSLLAMIMILSLRLLMPIMPGTAYLGESLDVVQVPDYSLLEDNQDGLTFEVRVPWQQLSINPEVVAGKEFAQISIPEFSNLDLAGAPSVPFFTVKFGVPFDASINMKVTPGKEHTFRLQAPIRPGATKLAEYQMPDDQGFVPLPQLETVFELDPKIYGMAARYPDDSAVLASDGIIRHQRVASVNVFPVQYNPSTLELTVFETVKLEILFQGGRSSTDGFEVIESDYYEALFSNHLLNYDTARQWRSKNADLAIDTEPSQTRETPWAPPEPGWRVKINEDGFYKLTYAELDAAGLAVENLDPITLQLFYLGNEIAIDVHGEEDHQFDPSDYLLFYGVGLNSKYASENVYWLTYGNSAQGLRMATRDVIPGTALEAAPYPALKHLEQNAYYFSQVNGDENLDRWMWNWIYAVSSTPGSWVHNFSLTAPAKDAGILRLKLVGYTTRSDFNPDHHVTVTLNDIELGETWWDGRSSMLFDLPVPEGVLQAGEANELILTCPNDLGTGSDIVFIDWVDLEYYGNFSAEDGHLAFSYDEPGTWIFQVDGFETEIVNLYDVSDPWQVVKLSRFTYPDIGLISFQDTVTETAHYWAMDSIGTRSVLVIEQDTSSNLRDTSNAADHITITHTDFLNQADQLRDFRTTRGLRAVSVDVQDIYDEFGYGIVGVEPIRDFLAYTYANWQAPAPSYVVLLGDGHYDPKNYVYAKENFIPPYLAPVDPWITETAADNRFAMLVGDDLLPDMILGRLAVNSTEEASAFVNKIINYEQNPEPGEWQYQVMTVADNADSGGNFPLVSDSLLSCCLPDGYDTTRVHFGTTLNENVTHTVITEARNDLFSGINEGKLIVNYVGHGAYKQWGDEGFLKAADVASLSNDAKLPVVLAMTCYDGFYHYPHLQSQGYESTAETVTRAGGKGAVASWSPTGLGVASGHDFLDRGFFNALFDDGVYHVGQAVGAGLFNLWSTGANLDLLNTYVFFGDPAMAMGMKAFDDEFEANSEVVLNIETPGVLANDFVSNGDPLTVTLVADVEHGNLNLNANGSFTYVSDPGFSGEDSFQYQTSDGVFLSNSATARITVSVGTNVPPVAEDDTYIVYGGELLSVDAPGVLVNDSGHSLSSILVLDVSHGTLDLNIDGSFTYSHDEGFVGEDSFTYKVYDGLNESEPAQVSISVSKKTAALTLQDLTQIYDGDPKPVTVTTVPSGLTLTVAYDGSIAVPINVGSYAVVATVVDDIYDGSVEGTLKINPREITVIADDQEKYVNTGDPELTYQVTPTLLTGDFFEGTLERDPGEEPGVYDINQGTLWINDENEGNNFALSFIKGTFFIKELPAYTLFLPIILN